jgi:hypothetical protein
MADSAVAQFVGFDGFLGLQGGRDKFQARQMKVVEFVAQIRAGFA